MAIPQSIEARDRRLHNEPAQSLRIAEDGAGIGLRRAPARPKSRDDEEQKRKMRRQAVTMAACAGAILMMTLAIPFALRWLQIIIP